MNLLKLTTGGDLQLLGCLSRLGSIGFNRLHDIHTLRHPTKHHMFAIQPRRLHRRQEELGSIGIGSRIRHGQDSRSRVLQVEVLVSEFLSVDGLSAGSVSTSEITTLQHEVGNDPMEHASLVTEALLAGAQGTEVFRRLGHDVRPQFHDDTTKGTAIGCHIKEYLGQVGHGFGGG